MATAPVSPIPEGIWATLTPVNALARLAFSDVYDALREKRKISDRESAPVEARMQIEPSQEEDNEVWSLRTGNRPGRGPRGRRPAGVAKIWTGRYLLGLDLASKPPRQSVKVGKAIGKGGHDLVLCTEAADIKHNLGVKGLHAYFLFWPDTQMPYISPKKLGTPEVRVNGQSVAKEGWTLHTHTASIDFGRLTYRFEYTNWSATAAFMRSRRDFLIKALGQDKVSAGLGMPTPSQSGSMVGQWSLLDTIDRRTFTAINSKNETVAVVRIERTDQNNDAVDREIGTMRKLTDLYIGEEGRGPIVMLKEVIGHHQSAPARGPLQEVHLAMVPATSVTLAKLVKQRFECFLGMPLEAVKAYRSAPLAVKSLHSRNFIHDNITAANIGVIGERAVLLNVGHALPLQAGAQRDPAPAEDGIVGYLAPERELERYDHAVDVWSLGVVGYELTYGRRPWVLNTNPWRNDAEAKALRPAFHNEYDAAIGRLTEDARKYPTAEHFVQLGTLIAAMLRHSAARGNNDPRITIDEALQHEAWGALREEMPAAGNRARVQ